MRMYTVETMTDELGGQYESPREISRHKSLRTAENSHRKNSHKRGCWIRRAIDGATLSPDGEWIGETS